jgi:hypothetical protein
MVVLLAAAAGSDGDSARVTVPGLVTAAVLVTVLVVTSHRVLCGTESTATT